jgi:hypothetical protein
MRYKHLGNLIVNVASQHSTGIGNQYYILIGIHLTDNIRAQHSQNMSMNITEILRNGDNEKILIRHCQPVIS